MTCELNDLSTALEFSQPEVLMNRLVRVGLSRQRQARGIIVLMLIWPRLLVLDLT